MPARKHAKAGLGAIAAAMVAVAVIGGLATDTTSDWYRSLDRPSWQPQGWVFSSVWTVLYVLIGFAWFRAWGWLEGPRRRPVLWLFATNAVLNVGWTWIFFQAEAPEAAGVEIVALLAAIVTLIALTWGPLRSAALALVPYAAWVAFATALTWRIAVSG